MDWSDTPEQAAFRASIRTLIQEKLPPYYRRQAEERRPTGLEGDWQNDITGDNPEARAAAQEWATVLYERGFSAPHWPKEYGGGGLTPMEHFVLNQEMAAAHAPIVGGQGISMFGPTVLLHGTEEQKRKLLPKTISGEYLWAQGFSEPGAGSDLASLQARAVLDGDEYVINGQKLWTSGAHKSNWIFGLFRTDPEAPKHRGISFIVMDMKTPGISVRPIISIGWEHATNETFYEDVRVPADQVIGEPNKGWYVGMTLNDFERSNIGVAVEIQDKLAATLANVKSPAAQQQLEGGGLQRQRLAIAQHHIEAGVLFNFSCRIISMQAAGLTPGSEGSVSKIFSSELIQRLSNTGMRLYGLYSNVWDPDNRYSPQKSLFTHDNLHSIVLTIYDGSNEIQRNIIATRGLGLPRG